MDRKKLTDEEIKKELSTLNQWSLKNGRLFCEYKFPDFVKAFRFMSGAALAAEAMNHHPNWSNVYNRVTVELFTHDAGGITALDFALARKMDELA